MQRDFMKQTYGWAKLGSMIQLQTAPDMNATYNYLHTATDGNNCFMQLTSVI